MNAIDDPNLVVQGVALVRQEVDESTNVSQGEVLRVDGTRGILELGVDEIMQERVELHGRTGDIDKLGIAEGFREARVKLGHSSNSGRVLEKCGLEGGDGLKNVRNLNGIINVYTSS